MPITEEQRAKNEELKARWGGRWVPPGSATFRALNLGYLATHGALGPVDPDLLADYEALVGSQGRTADGAKPVAPEKHSISSLDDTVGDPVVLYTIFQNPDDSYAEPEAMIIVSGGLNERLGTRRMENSGYDLRLVISPSLGTGQLSRNNFFAAALTRKGYDITGDNLRHHLSQHFDSAIKPIEIELDRDDRAAVRKGHMEQEYLVGIINASR